MADPKPRLRMFAGPNGSGKSTIKGVIPPEWLGVYINPDEMELAIKRDGGIRFSDFSVHTQADAVWEFLRASPLLDRAGLIHQVEQLAWDEGLLKFGAVAVNSYWASVLSDFVRQRVASGGHSVPTDKIVTRYQASLDLLIDAVACSSRAYFFDNSSHDRLWVAEATDGEELEMRHNLMPNWFKTALWDRFGELDTTTEES